jgi:hypothetical protein
MMDEMSIWEPPRKYNLATDRSDALPITAHFFFEFENNQ